MTETSEKQVPVFELDGVTKTYTSRPRFSSRKREDVTAVDNISLRIGRGEIFGLVGESGSGKTTTGRLLVKLEEPSAGVIRFNGEPVTDLRGKRLKAYRARVQMIFQDPYQSLNSHLSILETVEEPLIVNKIGDNNTRRARVIETLETVGLYPGKDFCSRYPHQLSGGQRQRVAVARAVILDPAFVVADEPTSMLDATIGIQLFQLLLDIRERYNMTFLFITHNLAAAGYLCDRLAVIHKGAVVETGSAQEIIRNPGHAYTQKLIRAQPALDLSG